MNVRARDWLTRGLVSLAITAAAQTPLFQIVTTHLPLPHAGIAYRAQLQATGGVRPYTWTLLQGALPPGLRLDAATGLIAGVPRTSQSFAVLVQVSDSGTPPLSETRLLPASAVAPLALRWTQAPSVSGQNVNGAVAVRNQSGQSVDLTVIAVAVNAIGKAFSLRYAHQTLAQKQSTGALSFAVFLPPGTYTLRVDAVAAVSPQVIFRQHLESAVLTIPKP